MSSLRKIASKLLFFTTLFVAGSCQSTHDEEIVKGVSEINRLLLSSKFEYDTLMKFLDHYEECFEHKLQRHIQNEIMSTTIDYFWNSDSTIVFIKSHKRFSQGFKRELALSTKVADNKSSLFVHMFNVQQDTASYAFIETFDYMSSSQVSKALGKIEFNAKEISDTIKFRQMPFNDLTLESQNNYSHWLDYWSHVIDHN